jgi:hypothetical protein
MLKGARKLKLFNLIMFTLDILKNVRFSRRLNARNYSGAVGRVRVVCSCKVAGTEFSSSCWVIRHINP